jgi:hypothetical protein
MAHERRLRTGRTADILRDCEESRVLSDIERALAGNALTWLAEVGIVPTAERSIRGIMRRSSGFALRVPCEPHARRFWSLLRLFDCVPVAQGRLESKVQATSYGFLLGGLHVQKHEASRGFHIEGEPFSLKR